MGDRRSVPRKGSRGVEHRRSARTRRHSRLAAHRAGNVQNSRTSSTARRTPRSVSAVSVTQRTSPPGRRRSRARGHPVRADDQQRQPRPGRVLTGEPTSLRTRSARSSRSAASWSSDPSRWEGLRGLAAVAVVNGNDKRAATLVGAADAHRYDPPEDPSRPGSKGCSSSLPAHGAEPAHGGPPRAKAARWASRLRSPTRRPKNGATKPLRRLGCSRPRLCFDRRSSLRCRARHLRVRIVRPR